MNKTAAIIIVGDEILSGQIEDCNSVFFTRELRDLGVSVRHIVIIPDDISEIANTLKNLSHKYDYVFTSGGIGPTHDDVTIEGIAKGFSVKLVRNTELEKIILKHFKDKTTEAAMKMSEIPEGAELIKDKNLKFPLIVFRNIFIFPGIPKYLKTKFEVIKERFRERPFYLYTLHVQQNESAIAKILHDAETIFHDVKIGSYPIVDCDKIHVKITIESKARETADKALEYIKNNLDPSTILRGK